MEIDNTQCKECLYKAVNPAGANIFNCWYILLTGKARKCEPSPNCTKFEKYTPGKRFEIVNRAQRLWPKG